LLGEILKVNYYKRSKQEKAWMDKVRGKNERKKREEG
jgi:hypothetical protein